MTLKLDMKHICKKEVRRRRGGGYLGLGGVSGRQEGSSAPMQRGRQGAQSFSEEGIQMQGPDCSSMISLILLQISSSESPCTIARDTNTEAHIFVGRINKLKKEYICNNSVNNKTVDSLLSSTIDKYLVVLAFPNVRIQHDKFKISKYVIFLFFIEQIYLIQYLHAFGLGRKKQVI